MKTQVHELEQNLKRFTGSASLFRIPLLNTYYTEGIQYLAQKANCYWLITDVSAVSKSLMKKSYLVTVDFKRLLEDEQKHVSYEAQITYSDGDGTQFLTQAYKRTDFPISSLRLFFIENILLLPGEY